MRPNRRRPDWPSRQPALPRRRPSWAGAAQRARRAAESMRHVAASTLRAAGPSTGRRPQHAAALTRRVAASTLRAAGPSTGRRPQQRHPACRRLPSPQEHAKAARPDAAPHPFQRPRSQLLLRWTLRRANPRNRGRTLASSSGSWCTCQALSLCAGPASSAAVPMPLVLRYATDLRARELRGRQEAPKEGAGGACVFLHHFYVAPRRAARAPSGIEASAPDGCRESLM